MSDKDQVIDAAFKDAEIALEVEEFRKGGPHQENVKIEMDDTTVTESNLLTSSAKGRPLWNRETGDMSMVLTDQAGLRLGQLFPMDHPTPEFRGQRVYTRTPMELVNPGKMLCRLHRDHPGRKVLDQWFKGQHCPKSNMLTQLDVDDHFEHKHKGEFKVVQDNEEREHKAAMLEMQRLQMESMQALAGKSPGTITVAGDGPTTTDATNCDFENCDYTGTLAQLRGHKSIHNKVGAATS